MKAKIAGFVLQFFTGRFFRNMEAGAHGSAAARVYAWTKGRKTWFAFFLSLGAYVSAQFDNTQAVSFFATLATVMGHAGLVDKGSRADAPEIPEGFRAAFQWFLTAASVASYLFFGFQQFLTDVPNCLECLTWSGRLDLWAAAAGVATSTITAFLEPRSQRG